jgi:integrase
VGDILNRGTTTRPLWYGRFVDIDGKRKQRATGAETKGEARIVVEGWEERVRQGLPGCPRGDRAEVIAAEREKLQRRAARASVTIEDLARRFLGEMEGDPGYAPPRIKDLRRYRWEARSILSNRVARLLPRSAAEVTTQDVERERDKLIADKWAAESVVHALNVLSKLFNWARRSGLIECANPVQGVERPRTSHSLDYLSAAEVGTLLECAEDSARVGVASWNALVLAPMATCAVFTGMRRGELAGLRWQDVNFDQNRVDVMRSYKTLPKSGKPRHVGLHPELAVVLRRWKNKCPPTKEGLVFPVLGDGPHARWRMASVGMGDLGLSALLALAGCHAPADGKPWHMLRHTFASAFVARGGSLYTLQQLLGHSTPLMTQRYAHLSPSHLSSEVARLSYAAPAPAGLADMGEERRRRAAEMDQMDQKMDHFGLQAGSGTKNAR